MANSILIIGIAHKDNRLVGMAEVDFFIGFFFQQVAVAHLAAIAANPPRHRFFLHEIEDFTLLTCSVTHELKQKIVFVADNFNVHGNWAFVGGTPQAVSGGSPDYGRTQYADAKESGAFDNNFFALLKKTSGKWKVVTYAIGCTDVCYADWWKRFKAPKAVFPYTE